MTQNANEAKKCRSFAEQSVFASGIPSPMIKTCEQKKPSRIWPKNRPKNQSKNQQLNRPKKANNLAKKLTKKLAKKLTKKLAKKLAKTLAKNSKSTRFQITSSTFLSMTFICVTPISDPRNSACPARGQRT